MRRERTLSHRDLDRRNRLQSDRSVFARARNCPATSGAAYAVKALARMADHIPDGPDDSGYPLMRRRDLGSDVYEAIVIESDA